MIDLVKSTALKSEIIKAMTKITRGIAKTLGRSMFFL